MHSFFWEHLESAVRNLSLFTGIILTAIVLSFIGNDDLHMSLGTKSTAFKESNLILNASLIHILPCFHIIEGIGNYISTLKELISKDFFRLFADLIKTSDDMSLQARIHLEQSCTGSGRLRLLHVLLSE